MVKLRNGSLLFLQTLTQSGEIFLHLISLSLVGVEGRVELRLLAQLLNLLDERFLVLKGHGSSVSLQFQLCNFGCGIRESGGQSINQSVNKPVSQSRDNGRDNRR